MKLRTSVDLPSHKQAAYRRAEGLAWLTIAFFASAVTAMALAMASSQAMRAALLEDLLGFVPPAVFLIAARLRSRPPDERYPYGWHRVVSVGYLCAALALLALGSLILLESLATLIGAERTRIEGVIVFGVQVWQGWLMIAALAYTAVPAVILGRLKTPLAHSLHDKILYADAEMNRADWMTAVAGIVGVAGVGAGLWWADASMAIVIGAAVTRDGWRNTRAAIAALMDKRPMTVQKDRPDPLPARVEHHLRDLPWVAEASVRFREEGHVYFGDALVVPTTTRDLVANIERAATGARALDWRLHDLVIMPVASLGDAGDEEPGPAAADEDADAGTGAARAR